MNGYTFRLPQLRFRLFIAFALVALIGSMTLAPLAMGADDQADAASPTLRIPITGTSVNSAGKRYTSFKGTFALTDTKVVSGRLKGTGTLRGIVTDSAGQTVGQVNQTATMPAQIVSSTCEILDLTLGPLDLDLLGLQVHLNRVHLNITAAAGPGNLLGNLLCAVAGLLNNGINLNLISSQLDVIIGVLRQLGL